MSVVFDSECRSRLLTVQWQRQKCLLFKVPAAQFQLNLLETLQLSNIENLWER
jgi:hypothetical protein